MICRSSISRGFTLIELVVSIAIFGLMTALVVAKYGNFNQSVLLTNLAYDVALTVRTAQTYGLSVKSSANDVAPGDSGSFRYAYGVHFSTSAGGESEREIRLFSDFDENQAYSGTTEDVSVYTIGRGAIISDLCAGMSSSCSPGYAELDILFKRPDPNATICAFGDSNPGCDKKYTEITVQATDGSTRTVSVRANGQISVED